jgi:hypothetical protein
MFFVIYVPVCQHIGMLLCRYIGMVEFQKGAKEEMKSVDVNSVSLEDMLEQEERRRVEMERRANKALGMLAEAWNRPNVAGLSLPQIAALKQARSGSRASAPAPAPTPASVSAPVAAPAAPAPSVDPPVDPNPSAPLDKNQGRADYLVGELFAALKSIRSITDSIDCNAIDLEMLPEKEDWEWQQQEAARHKEVASMYSESSAVDYERALEARAELERITKRFEKLEFFYVSRSKTAELLATYHRDRASVLRAREVSNEIWVKFSKAMEKHKKGQKKIRKQLWQQVAAANKVLRELSKGRFAKYVPGALLDAGIAAMAAIKENYKTAN